ncbi:Sensors of blue-light using FAD [Hymenobacter daecheongensis DSM 21074]|uniref:Sensors of blue-light using FAD n=1 Tax=Hymenobacter daecheongensis DSM 21074 TaxID=1121955 RepID=A0A1M6MQS5_9BACT|nr:BLUF domain-containing protein [Hymenobacter daecheongensis]SHJ85749.1 Sensors of blue-light using FAD [Hymenobacter daecheongensis DSM 21074]
MLPPVSLHKIIYRSAAVRPFSPEQLRELLHAARRYNHAARISGLLLYAEGHFLQVLEGEPAAVQALYQRILADPRHTHVTTTFDGPVPQRAFPDWSMGFAGDGGAATTYIVGYVDAGRLNFLLPRAAGMPAALLAQIQQFLGQQLPPVLAQAFLYTPQD